MKTVILILVATLSACSATETKRDTDGFAFDGIRIGAVGDIADSASQRAETVKRTLWSEQRFDPRNVEQLEVIVERHLAQIDAERDVDAFVSDLCARGFLED